MDRKPQENPEIQRLIDLGSVARSCLGQEVTALRSRLDIPSRIRSSLEHHPAAWGLGSLASGFLASCLFRRKNPQAKKRRRFPATLLDITWSAARPVVKIWLANHFKRWMIERLACAVQDNRIPSRPARIPKSS